ncbi:MAG: prepilin peptidase, partial [Candidatus Doudnabacteria bacterium]|nr:prepilin peptidase [Candidatus Doudnabacteria bacterium]
MKFFFDFFFFTLGLVIGSFLNAVIFRLRYSRSLLGHSACPDCGHRLGAIDLVPIVSFVWLRGRCRFCRRPISWQYPLVELTTGLVFLLAFRHNLSQLAWGLSGEFVFFTAFELIAVALLILIFVYDLKYFLIPDVFVILGVVGSLLFRILAEKSLADGLYGVLVVSGFFGFLYLVSSGKWIGFGDVKLGLFLGLLLGVRLSLVMLMLA